MAEVSGDLRRTDFFLDPDSWRETVVDLINSHPRTAYFANVYPFLGGQTAARPLLDFQDRLVGTLAFGLRRNSEFGRAFDHHLLRMKEKGILDQGWDASFI